jgi:ISXO2-like transposase domain
MMHRLREALRTGGLAPMGGEGGVVEIGETYIGCLQGQPKPRRGGAAHKIVVLTLVERGGSASSSNIDSTSIAQVVPIIRENGRRERILVTDEAPVYDQLGGEFLSHGNVNNARKEYVRDGISTNTVEGYYSIFKRCMKWSISTAHRSTCTAYMAEYNFGYSKRSALGVDDYNRAEIAAKGIVGKRLPIDGLTAKRRPRRIKSLEALSPLTQKGSKT